MKTKFYFFLISLFCTISAYAQVFTFGGLEYIGDPISQTAILLGNNPNISGSINIPSVVTDNTDNFLVTSINNSAFLNCYGLTTVTIPNSVTSIGSFTFAGCYNLTSISLPNSITIIEPALFSGCTSLTSVSLPNSISSIGESFFSNCTSLTSITIPNSVTSIDKMAFVNCSALSSINIPNSVTSIGEYAFEGCSVLKSLNIPNSVTTIVEGTFNNCFGLTSVNIPNSVTSIGDVAFNGCSVLTTLNIPNSVTTIGDVAFANCFGLTLVTVNWSTPLPINANVFAGLNLPSISLNVPTGTATIYDTVSVWEDFNIATLGINLQESKYSKLFIYPNPSSNFISIQNKENTKENFTYKIVDLTGRNLKSGNSIFNEQINIESLTNGNYIIQIETESGKQIVEKLIKN